MLVTFSFHREMLSRDVEGLLLPRRSDWGKEFWNFTIHCSNLMFVRNSAIEGVFSRRGQCRDTIHGICVNISNERLYCSRLYGLVEMSRR